jgi:hypothetical protein
MCLPFNIYAHTYAYIYMRAYTHAIGKHVFSPNSYESVAFIKKRLKYRSYSIT